MKLLALAGSLELLFLAIRLIPNPRNQIPVLIVLLLLSGIFYLVSCYCVSGGGAADSRARNSTGWILAAAAIFRVTIFTMQPVLSDDVFRYRWEGKLQSVGANPYAVRPNDPAWSAMRDETFESVPGRDFRAVYGPLTERIELLTYRIAASFEQNPWRQAFWFKAPAAIFDLGTIGMLLLWLRARGLPLERVLLYAWSPLGVMEFWGSGHNDSIALCFLALALAAVAVNRWTLSYASLALAAAAKLWPLFLLPLWAGRPWSRIVQGTIMLPIIALLAAPYWTEWSGIDENFR
ncbi:MAG: hypothetical protein ABIZ80_20280, partial [Bryobacteraceae bacterium]